MDLKKKVKGFFTLIRKADGGFTLVELIVVIAILAILGGVAVPAYNGYIEKANRANDEALLAEINTAFASACLINGEANYYRNDVKGGIEGEKFVYTKPFAEEFATYFESEDAEFKVYSYLMYDRTTGMFVEGINKLAEILGLSSFGNHLGTIVGDVDDLVGMMSAYLENNKDMLLGTGFADYLAEMGLSDASEEEMANAAVLYLASQAAAMDDADIGAATVSMLDLFLTGVLEPRDDGSRVGINEDHINALADVTGSSLSAYGALYATAEAIALQKGTDSEIYQNLKKADLKDPTSVLGAVNAVFAGSTEGEINTYLESNLASDMEAYFKALQTVNSKEDELMTQIKGNEEFNLTESSTVKDLVDQLEN